MIHSSVEDSSVSWRYKDRKNFLWGKECDVTGRLPIMCGTSVLTNSVMDATFAWACISRVAMESEAGKMEIMTLSSPDADCIISNKISDICPRNLLFLLKLMVL